VLDWSLVDREFESWSGQTKDYKIGLCCFPSNVESVVQMNDVFCNVESVVQMNDVFYNVESVVQMNDVFYNVEYISISAV
jgi:hypothetical protein